jgi:HK97 family phage prohead protease
MPSSIVHKESNAGFDAGLNCVLSDLTQDAYQDIVGDPAHPTLGWDTRDFERNPIALWSHDSRSPIGVWKDVHVATGALRGRLHLAPPGSTKLVDELRALLAASVIKGISVGFKPVESKPRSNGGTHYLRQTLIEASLCAVPANPSALLTAKALGVSPATIKMVFKETEGERIRGARRVIAKLKAQLAIETNPKTRTSMMRAIAQLEKVGSEYTSYTSLTSEREQMERRLEQSRIDLEVSKLVREEMRTASWQKKRETAQTIGAFTRQAMRHPQDPPPHVPSTGLQVRWRGQVIDMRLRWRGKPIV